MRNIEEIAYKLKTTPLPGLEAQRKMANAFRRRDFPVPNDVRKAAVMALFYAKDTELHFVLIERTSLNPNDRHKGQISFPGGRHEKNDPYLKDTALREVHEEIGIDPIKINLIGQLSELFIPVSNHLVYPYVGYLDESPTFVPQISEVKNILEVPFNMLFDPQTIQQTEIQVSTSVILKNVPFYNVNGHVVWGATAMILSELVEITR